MRLFLAILPNPPVRRALEAVQKNLLAQGAKGRFSRPENLHLTLAFLGELPHAALPRIQRCMEEAVIPGPAVLSFETLGFFHRRDGNVCYISAAPSPWLLRLQKQLAGALDKARISYDPKPFRPHLTLGRNIKFPPGAPTPVQYPVPDLPVSSIALMESHRVNGVLTYTLRHQVPLL